MRTIEYENKILLHSTKRRKKQISEIEIVWLGLKISENGIKPPNEKHKEYQRKIFEGPEILLRSSKSTSEIHTQITQTTEPTEYFTLLKKDKISERKEKHHLTFNRVQKGVPEPIKLSHFI